ncbi:MAG: hypothetical protein P4M14_06730 [Gammaproteobacteria bacterium]|nr:hypothetical protein [Gammaproteobacteria bacterium]
MRTIRPAEVSLATETSVRTKFLSPENQALIQATAHFALDFRIGLFGLSPGIIKTLVEEVYADLLRIAFNSHEFCTTLKKAISFQVKLDVLIEHCIAELCALIQLIAEDDIENTLLFYVQSADDESDVLLRLNELDERRQKAYVILSEKNKTHAELSDEKWKKLLREIKESLSAQAHADDKAVLQLSHVSLNSLPAPLWNYFYCHLENRQLMPVGLSMYLVYIVFGMHLTQFLTQQEHYKIVLHPSIIDRSLEKSCNAYFNADKGELEQSFLWKLQPLCRSVSDLPVSSAEVSEPQKNKCKRKHRKAKKEVAETVQMRDPISITTPKTVTDAGGNKYIELSAYHRHGIFYRHNPREFEENKFYLKGLTSQIESEIEASRNIHAKDSKCAGLKAVDPDKEKKFKGYLCKLKLKGIYSHLRIPIHQRSPTQEEQSLIGADVVEVFSPASAKNK